MQKKTMLSGTWSPSGLLQVQFLFKEFERDYTSTIDPEIIEDIYKQSNGRINDNLIQHFGRDRRLSFVEWTKFVTKSIDNQMIDYSTFRKMVEMLNTNNRVKPAVDLLRSMFLGFFDFVPIYDKKELRLAEFLVALGVLMRNEKTKNEFKMSSVFVDALIQKQVIPVLYKSCPTIPVPQTNEGTLKTLDILKETIHCFDKTIIYNAFNRSFKTALVTVNDQCNVRVPRESVYDTELNRILVNWIVKECNLEVTGQWHLIDEKDKHNYSDIIITSQHQTVILEILATATKKELNEHFERVLNYAEKLSTNEIWIVHFTCEDGAIQNLHWPPDDRKFGSVNVVHFFHDWRLENV
nr:1732_t:CDS:2 [Entrophospora candida]